MPGTLRSPASLPMRLKPRARAEVDCGAQVLPMLSIQCMLASFLTRTH